MMAFAINNFQPGFSGSNSYQAAANLNKQLFDAQQQAWASNLASYQAGMQGVTSGWQNLTNQAMGLLRGSNRANLQDIADKYTALSGQMSNQMIDRGLGNSTVQQAMQIGLRASQAKEATRSRGEFAQLLASTLGSLGGSGLASMERGVSGASDIMRGYSGFLNSVSAPYPQYGGMSMAGYGGPPTVIGGGRPTGGFQPSNYSAGVSDMGGGGYGMADPSFYARAPVSSQLGYFNGYGGEDAGSNNALGGVAGGLAFAGQPSGAPGFWANMANMATQGYGGYSGGAVGGEE